MEIRIAGKTDWGSPVGLFDRILDAKHQGKPLGAVVRGIRKLKWNPWTELDMENLGEDENWTAEALEDFQTHLKALKLCRLEELIVVGLSDDLGGGVWEDFVEALPKVHSE